MIDSNGYLVGTSIRLIILNFCVIFGISRRSTLIWDWDILSDDSQTLNRLEFSKLSKEEYQFIG